MSKNLPSTLTFRQKIAELQKIVEHCVVVDEKRPSETLYENNIDENSNFECLRKLKNGRGRRKKKCEMIVEEEEKINKKELAIKKIFSFKEFHFNSGKKQKMIEKP